MTDSGTTAGQQLFWDNTNKRLGIGTATPDTALYIKVAAQYGGVRVGNGTNRIAELVGLSASNDDGALALFSGATRKILISASASTNSYINNGGNVGIGTTNPSDLLHVSGGDTQVSSAAPQVKLVETDNSNNYFNLVVDGGSFGLRYNNGWPGPLQITSAGNVGIGTASPGYMLDVKGSIHATGYVTRRGVGAVGSSANRFNIDWTGSCVDMWIDMTNMGCFMSFSDRRLKDDIKPLSEDALSTVMKLRPVMFQWKDKGMVKKDGIVHHGFIADELQQAIPSAVIGAPRDVDKDGNERYQTVQINEVVPVLAKAIQELKSHNDDLRAQLKAANDNQAEAIEDLRREIQALKARQ